MRRRQKLGSRKEEMEENVVIEISPSSTEKDTRLRNPTCEESEMEEEEDVSPLRPIFCLKKKADMKCIEETEDCFIIDFNPSNSVDIAKLSVTNEGDDVDLSVLAEKGQVACRDYPHSRHLCLQFPFDAAPHDRHCNLCYCYVCDSAAPCKYWMAHCHASEHGEVWKSERHARILESRPQKL